MMINPLHGSDAEANPVSFAWKVQESKWVRGYDTPSPFSLKHITGCIYFACTFLDLGIGQKRPSGKDCTNIHLHMLCYPKGKSKKPNRCACDGYYSCCLPFLYWGEIRDFMHLSGKQRLLPVLHRRCKIPGPDFPRSLAARGRARPRT